jgi:phosphoadenosine phosphosulfate reductase
MYSYTYDAQTGGILLNSTPTGFSKEPRPVYAQELNVLGFDKHWKYDQQSDFPYMWAEANHYYYRGTLVAKLKGGNIYNAPEIIIPTDDGGKPVKPEPRGKKLRPIDIGAMVEANRDMLTLIEQTTVKKILSIHKKYFKRFTKHCGIFHVAFSGGKDSQVLLDLVKKTLPKDDFFVLFGDTGMEFPDTYDIIDKTKEQCKEEGIRFESAESHLNPQQSWEMFGPPSHVLRWCCHVHKSAPQTLKLREITGLNDYESLDFVGVRKYESIARSDYQYENYGKKQKGQYSHNPILEWTSAEIWLYIYANDITVNAAYTKGNGRAGCLLCPMSGGTSDYLRYSSYTNEIDEYLTLIRKTYDVDKREKKKIDSYIFNGGWSARKNGRELANNVFRCHEKNSEQNLIIEVTDPSSDWREWIIPIGDLIESKESYAIQFNDEVFDFAVKDRKNGYTVTIANEILKYSPAFSKMFRQTFRKAAYCKSCRVCEANCKNGCIKFVNQKVSIENCDRCRECHAIDSGCLAFHSLRHPQGGGKSMKSLNSFADHAPKSEWLRSFFELKEAFFSEHTLGPMMYDMFRRFLKDAELNEKNHFTLFAELISRIGWETDSTLGLILVNLVNNNPQMQWYTENFDIAYLNRREDVIEKLLALDVKPKDANSIVKSFKRIVETPIGTTLNWGYVTMEKKAISELVRTKCSVSDPRVILYALFKFAEKCGDYKGFTLTTLLNENIERDGISPTRIFGLDRDDMQPILLGLSAKYPEFINASFTHDMDKITLAEDKTSQDVLDLF